MTGRSAPAATWLGALTIAAAIALPTGATAQKGDGLDLSNTDAAAAADQDGENWSVQCLDAAAGPATGAGSCRAYQNMVMPDTGDRLLTVLVEPQASGAPYRIALALPHGLYLPAGVELRIDDAEPIAAPITTSDADGAYAAVPANPSLIMAMKAGEILNVSFRASTQRGFTVPVSLSGFAAALDQIEQAGR